MKFLSFFFITLLLLDTYLWMGLAKSPQLHSVQRRLLKGLLYPTTALLGAGLVFMFAFADLRQYNAVRLPLMLLFLAVPLSKMCMTLILMVDDIGRLVRGLWRTRGRLLYAYCKHLLARLKGLFRRTYSVHELGPRMARSTFLTQTAWAVGAAPVLLLSYGMWKGAHNYQIKRVELNLSTLPKAFDGLTLLHISDIHVGSFIAQAPIHRGIDLIREQRPDLIFFTGDLVNDKTDEMKDYVALFQQIKAPLGVFSVLGNHDYGDYVRWPSAAARQRNLLDMYAMHKALGWRLLRNESARITLSGEQIAILGVENWSRHARFMRYGNLAKALEGTQDLACRLLLSHDPSHWDAEIRYVNPLIEATFSGHTHGFQFGIEYGPIKWSPAQYLYKQWAGLYQTSPHSIYVNRGFGYIGYPGRIGMPPEITCFKLRRAT